MIGFQPARGVSWGMGVSLGLLVFFIFLAGVAIFNHNQIDYPQDDLGLFTYHSDQCERPVDRSWMAEVQNTLSNASYVLAGALILLRAGSWAGLMLGANLVVLGAMSALYHATLGHEEPQIADVAWVYAALLALSVYIAYMQMQSRQPLRLPGAWPYICSGLFVALGLVVGLGFGWSTLVPFICLALIVGVFTALCYVIEKKLSDFVWVAVILIIILAVGIPILGVFIKVEFKWDSSAVFVIMIGILIIQLLVLIAGAKMPEGFCWQLTLIGVLLEVGAVCRLGDGYNDIDETVAVVVVRKLLCNPDAVVQPHALWHLIGGAALLLAYDLFTRFQAPGRQPIDKPLIFPELIFPDAEPAKV